MDNLSNLVRAPLPPSVRVDDRVDGLPKISVSGAHASAEVYFQGAHVTSWSPARATAPVIWMSGQSAFEHGRAIRGGVPICFPWFGPRRDDPAAPLHGFARVRDWTLTRADEDPAGNVILQLELAGEGAEASWPHRFQILHRVEIGAVLRMTLEVRNPGAEAFAFEEALHTYLGVEDVRAVSVTGLEDTEYLDKVSGGARARQGAEPLRITGETDRVYLDTAAACVIDDPGFARRITIAKRQSAATVVWNPWVAKARAMPDFGDDEWPGMLCVETCNVNVHAVKLEPGESHAMAAVIEVQ